MSDSNAMESDCENSLQSKTGIIESQRTICNNSEVDIEKVKTTLNSSNKLNEEIPNANVINNCSNETTSTCNEEQAMIINTCEKRSILQVCTESSTDNEQMNVLNKCDKDVNKNIEMKENVVSLEGDTSATVNENGVTNESIHEDNKQLNSHLLPEFDISTNDLTCNISNSLASQFFRSTDRSRKNVNRKTFGLVPDLDSCLLPSNSTDIISSSSDNSIVISNINAVPQSDSIVSSNLSLSQIRCYGSNESLNEDSLEVTTYYRDTNNTIYLSDKESDSDSSSTSSSSSILISDSDSDPEGGNITLPKPIKAKGELDLNDLPPIEDLKISVPEQDCVPVGHVFQIVDKLVVIQAVKEMPALNLDTVLFLQEGKPFGKIFDVFGPVAEPYYCVRFNSNDHIKDKNISVNQMVYCAPKTKYTNYIFLAQLLKFKGSDASWENDLEPPEMFLEYSDDEQEQKAKKKALRKNAKKKQHSDPDEPARKKHFSYERKMNKRNLQISAARKKPGSHQTESSLWSPSSTFTDVASSSHSSIPNVPHQIFGRPPAFIPRIPPTTGYFSPSPDMFSPSSDVSPKITMFPTTPMFAPRPNRFEPRPDIFPSTPDRFPPRRDMFPPRPDMFSPRPNMFPPSLDTFPPRPDMNQARPEMFPPRPPMLQSRPSNFLGTNSTNRHPSNSFQSAPPKSIDSNSSTYFPQPIQPPMISHGPVGNNRSLSPVGTSRLNYNESNHRMRNLYPNQPGSRHGNHPTGNMWSQRPQHPSLGSPPSSFWPRTQPNNSPHAYPPSNPF